MAKRTPESFRPESRLDTLRIPPQNVEAEQSVLGGLMLDPRWLDRVRILLQEQDFYQHNHRLIYRAILELAEKRRPFDQVTLGEWFEANQLGERIGGPGYLIQLASDTPSAANILAYAEIVHRHSIGRQAIEKGTEIVNAAFESGKRDVGQVLVQAQEGLARLALSAANAERMRPADLRALAGEKATPPRFVMAPYFPRGVVTLLGGHGGAGKSTLALTHGAHVAAGRWWAGHAVEPGRVVMFSLEDEARVVGFRLQRIVDQYGLDADQVFANLQVFDWSDGDTALAVEKSEFGIHTLEATALFARLKVAAAGADLVIIDNASDAFDANENSKRQVRGFFHMLKTGIAQPNDCAVVLLAHIDKNAARFGAAGNSYSGSTAWHNSARSRLALVESKEDGLELRQEKANFGKKAEAVALRTADFGVLVPCAPGEGGGSTPNEGQDAAGVLAAMRAAAIAGTPVGTNRTSTGNTHSVLSSFGALPARLKSTRGKDAFYAALDALIATGRVVTSEVYINRNKRRVYVEAGTESSSLFPPHPPTRGSHEVTTSTSTGRGFGTGGLSHESHESHESRPAEAARTPDETPF